MPYDEHIGKSQENQVQKLVWSTPTLEEIPYVEHEWRLSWFDTVTTSLCERDENGVAIIPFPGPTRAEILELRALANHKNYTEEERQQYFQIANIMETAMAERPVNADDHMSQFSRRALYT